MASALDFEPEVDFNILPVCPHCSREQPDPWEIDIDDEESTETECLNCCRPFEVRCSVTVRYSTRPA